MYGGWPSRRADPASAHRILDSSWTQKSHIDRQSEPHTLTRLTPRSVLSRQTRSSYTETNNQLELQADRLKLGLWQAEYLVAAQKLHGLVQSFHLKVLGNVFRKFLDNNTRATKRLLQIHKDTTEEILSKSSQSVSLANDYRSLLEKQVVSSNKSLALTKLKSAVKRLNQRSVFKGYLRWVAFSRMYSSRRRQGTSPPMWGSGRRNSPFGRDIRLSPSNFPDDIRHMYAEVPGDYGSPHGSRMSDLIRDEADAIHHQQELSNQQLASQLRSALGKIASLQNEVKEKETAMERIGNLRQEMMAMMEKERSEKNEEVAATVEQMTSKLRDELAVNNSEVSKLMLQTMSKEQDVERASMEMEMERLIHEEEVQFLRDEIVIQKKKRAAVTLYLHTSRKLWTKNVCWSKWRHFVLGDETLNWREKALEHMSTVLDLDSSVKWEVEKKEEAQFELEEAILTIRALEKELEDSKAKEKELSEKLQSAESHGSAVEESKTQAESKMKADIQEREKRIAENERKIRDMERTVSELQRSLQQSSEEMGSTQLNLGLKHEEIEGLRETVVEREQEISILRDQMSTLEGNLSDCEKARDEKESEVSRLNGDCSDLRATVDNLREELAASREENEDTCGKLRAETTERESLEQLVEKAREDCSRLREELESCRVEKSKVEMRSVEADSAVEKTHAILSENVQKLKETELSLNDRSGQVSELKQKVEEMEAEIEGREQERKDLLSQLTSGDGQIEALTEQLTSKIKEAEETSQNKDAEISDLKKGLQQEEEKVSSLLAQVSVLREQVRETKEELSTSLSRNSELSSALTKTEAELKETVHSLEECQEEKYGLFVDLAQARGHRDELTMMLRSAEEVVNTIAIESAEEKETMVRVANADLSQLQRRQRARALAKVSHLVRVFGAMAVERKFVTWALFTLRHKVGEGERYNAKLTGELSARSDELTTTKTRLSSELRQKQLLGITAISRLAEGRSRYRDAHMAQRMLHSWKSMSETMSMGQSSAGRTLMLVIDRLVARRMVMGIQRWKSFVSNTKSRNSTRAGGIEGVLKQLRRGVLAHTAFHWAKWRRFVASGYVYDQGKSVLEKVKATSARNVVRRVMLASQSTALKRWVETHERGTKYRHAAKRLRAFGHGLLQRYKLSNLRTWEAFVKQERAVDILHETAHAHGQEIRATEELGEELFLSAQREGEASVSQLQLDIQRKQRFIQLQKVEQLRKLVIHTYRSKLSRAMAQWTQFTSSRRLDGVHGTARVAAVLKAVVQNRLIAAVSVWRHFSENQRGRDDRVKFNFARALNRLSHRERSAALSRWRLFVASEKIIQGVSSEAEVENANAVADMESKVAQMNEKMGQDLKQYFTRQLVTALRQSSLQSLRSRMQYWRSLTGNLREWQLHTSLQAAKDTTAHARFKSITLTYLGARNQRTVEHIKAALVSTSLRSQLRYQNRLSRRAFVVSQGVAVRSWLERLRAKRVSDALITWSYFSRCMTKARAFAASKVGGLLRLWSKGLVASGWRKWKKLITVQALQNHESETVKSLSKSHGVHMLYNTLSSMLSMRLTVGMWRWREAMLETILIEKSAVSDNLCSEIDASMENAVREQGRTQKTIQRMNVKKLTSILQRGYVDAILHSTTRRWFSFSTGERTRGDHVLRRFWKGVFVWTQCTLRAATNHWKHNTFLVRERDFHARKQSDVEEQASRTISAIKAHASSQFNDQQQILTQTRARVFLQMLTRHTTNMLASAFRRWSESNSSSQVHSTASKSHYKRTIAKSLKQVSLAFVHSQQHRALSKWKESSAVAREKELSSIPDPRLGEMTEALNVTKTSSVFERSRSIISGLVSHLQQKLLWKGYHTWMVFAMNQKWFEDMSVIHEEITGEQKRETWHRHQLHVKLRKKVIERGADLLKGLLGRRNLTLVAHSFGRWRVFNKSCHLELVAKTAKMVRKEVGTLSMVRLVKNRVMFRTQRALLHWISFAIADEKERHLWAKQIEHETDVGVAEMHASSLAENLEMTLEDLEEKEIAVNLQQSQVEILSQSLMERKHMHASVVKTLAAVKLSNMMVATNYKAMVRAVWRLGQNAHSISLLSSLKQARTLHNNTAIGAAKSKLRGFLSGMIALGQFKAMKRWREYVLSVGAKNALTSADMTYREHQMKSILKSLGQGMMAKAWRMWRQLVVSEDIKGAATLERERLMERERSEKEKMEGEHKAALELLHRQLDGERSTLRGLESSLRQSEENGLSLERQMGADRLSFAQSSFRRILTSLTNHQLLQAVNKWKTVCALNLQNQEAGMSGLKRVLQRAIMADSARGFSKWKSFVAGEKMANYDHSQRDTHRRKQRVWDWERMARGVLQRRVKRLHRKSLAGGFRDVVLTQRQGKRNAVMGSNTGFALGVVRATLQAVKMMTLVSAVRQWKWAGFLLEVQKTSMDGLQESKEHLELLAQEHEDEVTELRTKLEEQEEENDLLLETNHNLEDKYGELEEYCKVSVREAKEINRAQKAEMLKILEARHKTVSDMRSLRANLLMQTVDDANAELDDDEFLNEDADPRRWGLEGNEDPLHHEGGGAEEFGVLQPAAISYDPRYHQQKQQHQYPPHNSHSHSHSHRDELLSRGGLGGQREGPMAAYDQVVKQKPSSMPMPSKSASKSNKSSNNIASGKKDYPRRQPLPTEALQPSPFADADDGLDDQVESDWEEFDETLKRSAKTFSSIRAQKTGNSIKSGLPRHPTTSDARRDRLSKSSGGGDNSVRRSGGLATISGRIHSSRLGRRERNSGRDRLSGLLKSAGTLSDDEPNKSKESVKARDRPDGSATREERKARGTPRSTTSSVHSSPSFNGSIFAP